MPQPYILCIDDNPHSIQTLFFLLDAEGYNCASASSSTEALKLISTGGIGLVILDHGLPEMTGTELAEKIREVSSVPILMLTGRTELEKPSVVDELLIKPQDPNALLNTVSRLMATHGAGRLSAGR